MISVRQLRTVMMHVIIAIILTDLQLIEANSYAARVRAEYIIVAFRGSYDWFRPVHSIVCLAEDSNDLLQSMYSLIGLWRLAMTTSEKKQEISQP